MGCAFCGLPPLDGEPCCTSDFKRDTMRKADKELRELRFRVAKLDAANVAWAKFYAERQAEAEAVWTRKPPEVQ